MISEYRYAQMFLLTHVAAEPLHRTLTLNKASTSLFLLSFLPLFAALDAFAIFEIPILDQANVHRDEALTYSQCLTPVWIRT